MYPVSLEGARIRAREFSLADADVIFDAADRSIFGPETFNALTEAEDWVRRIQADARAAGRVRFRLAAELIETGELIGGCRVNVDVPHDMQGSLGYALRKEFRGVGYATEAAELMLELGFGLLGLHRLEALVMPENDPSIRVLERIGMRREGHIKERFLEPDGWRDAYVYGMTLDEWRARTER